MPHSGCLHHRLGPLPCCWLAPVKKCVSSTCRKFAIEKLQSAQTAKAFENRVTTLLAENPPLSSSIDSISHCMRTAAEDVLGYYRPQRNNWYQQDCRAVLAAKDAAHRDTLQSVTTRVVRERYRDLRSEEKRVKLRRENLMVLG